MGDVHRAADNFFTEVDHLDAVFGRLDDDLDEDTIRLALSIAKRGRTQLTLVVRELARLRDQLQP